MPSKRDSVYVNKELQDTFAAKEHGTSNREPRGETNKRKSGKLDRKRWEYIYWSVPVMLFLWVIVGSIEDDPTMSGLNEVFATLIVALILACAMFGVFFIPYWFIKRSVNKKRTPTGINNNRASRESDNESKIKNWTLTCLLLGLAPFTLFASLLLIPFVWGFRFGNISRSQTKSRVSSSEHTKRPVKKRHYLRYALILLTFITCVYFYGSASNLVTVFSSSASATDSINDIANNSGFSLEGKALFYSTKPALMNADEIVAECPLEDQTTIEFGCYDPNTNRMYILEVPDPLYKDIEYTTAAHETLHAAWYKIDDYGRGDVASLIQQFYNDSSNPEAVKFHETLKPYGTDEPTIIAELHSFMGSETPDEYIGAQLVRHYDRYFSDRSATINANVQFNSKLDNTVASLNSELARLNGILEANAAYAAQHLDNIEAAINRARYYGDAYSEGRNVDAYNKNLVYYNNQVDYYNRQRDIYNQKVNTYNAVLKSFYPSRAPIHTQ